jgi:tRNA threonylcarbamoyladenosine biosynthesis protein TsaB
MTQPPCLIAFDAAGRSCAAALLRGGELLAERFEVMARGQAERLVPMIEEVLSEAGIAHGELDALAVTVGPGGFTGLRIGLAAARGYALALGIPQIAVTSFEAIAEATRPAEREGRELLVLLDAKREDFYAQLFSGTLEPLGQPFCATAEDLADRLPAGPFLLAGDAVEQALPGLDGVPFLRSAAPAQVSAAAVARVAARRGLPKAGSPQPQPLYLRPPDVTQPKKAARPGA